MLKSVIETKLKPEKKPITIKFSFLTTPESDDTSPLQQCVSRYVCVFLRMYPLYPCFAFATEFIDFYTEEHHQSIPFSIPWPQPPTTPLTAFLHGPKIKTKPVLEMQLSHVLASRNLVFINFFTVFRFGLLWHWSSHTLRNVQKQQQAYVHVFTMVSGGPYSIVNRARLVQFPERVQFAELSRFSTVWSRQV